MAHDECSGIARASSFSAPPRRLISRLDVVLNRPLLLGLVAVLASLLCGSALAQSDAIPEVKPIQSAISTSPIYRPESASSDGVPLLFLAILGLASLALSQTRASIGPEHRDAAFCSGKKVARGQDLPQERRPRAVVASASPVLGRVRTREHHHDIMGLESVG
jgi:hypothetical protein